MVSLNLDIPERSDDEEDITDKQISFIHALLREVGGSQFPDETLRELGKWQASAIIDQLQSFKKQLAGDKPLDTAKLDGLDDSESGGAVKWVIGVTILLVVLYLVF